jgi:hypothetical protein
MSEEKILKYLGIGRSRLRELIKRGLPHGKLPDKDQLRFNSAKVDKWLEQNAAGEVDDE